jgi:hypothetical protein
MGLLRTDQAGRTSTRCDACGLLLIGRLVSNADPDNFTIELIIDEVRPRGDDTP